jgi:hypothetical protein
MNNNDMPSDDIAQCFDTAIIFVRVKVEMIYPETR